MDKFNTALQFTLSPRAEGKTYVNNKYDPGGATKFGISQAQYPHLDIFNLTEEQASKIYFKDYWNGYHFDEFPCQISVCCFDFGVNSGPKKAIIELQKTLNIDADGVIGNETINAINNAEVDSLVIDYNANRQLFMLNILNNRNSIKGWYRRVNALTQYVAKLKE